MFTTVQSLAAQYGFQVDSSRNQAEHLLMILVNETTVSDRSIIAPVIRIHTKLFRNYRKWCDRMGVPPFLCIRYAPKIDDQITTLGTAVLTGGPGDALVVPIAAYMHDILLFLLIWGEAANLKHMPESLGYLYHKSMQESKQFVSLSVNKEMYPGYFLDMVVTPIYEVVAAGLSKKGDHNDKKTYDDFNEFFWDAKCLAYRLVDHVFSEDIEHAGSGLRASFNFEFAQGVTVPKVHVSEALQASTKTYVEKRSWLHPLLSMHRIFEWHILTFSLLMFWAFSNKLVWTWVYTVKVSLENRVRENLFLFFHIAKAFIYLIKYLTL